MYVYALSHSSSFISLPLSKALFISPCLLHVDMENILGGNSNDSYIHTVSLCSVFVFKLHFSPNRVYKPCLTSADHSLLYSLDSGTLGCSAGKELLRFHTFLMDNVRNCLMDYGSWTIGDATCWDYYGTVRIYIRSAIRISGITFFNW